MASQQSANEGVRIERHGAGDVVAELVLDRPAAMNAVSTAQATSLVAATHQLAEDPSVRAVVVTSSSAKAFCVGADLKERNRFTDAELRAQRPVARAAYAGILNLPVPVVAAVHGFALGGGFEIALGCDLIVADDTAVFALPEVSVGVIPGGGGTVLLARRVGWNRAADLIFTARRVSAEEGYRVGFVDRLVPAGQARTAALELAEAIAANSPIGVRNAKRAIRSALAQAAIGPADVAAWDLHCTGTPGDVSELELAREFVVPSTAMIARKGVFGHGMANAGGWELTALGMALVEGRTTGTAVPAEDIHPVLRRRWGDALVTGARPLHGTHAVKVMLGIGGVTAAVVLRTPGAV